MPNVKLNGNRDERTDLSATSLTYLQPACSRRQARQLLHHQMSAQDARERRYALAEQQLITTFFHCSSEPSTRQIQIRTLEKATDLLKAHVQDLSWRAQGLQETLNDHSVGYSAYSAVQEEKWMTNHRQQELNLETERLQQALHQLKNDRETTAVPSRREGNLARFLALSHTRTRHSRRSVAHRAPKRMTKADVRPFHLSAAEPPRKLFKPLSFETSALAPKPKQVASLPAPSPPRMTIDTALIPVLEEPTPSPTDQSSSVATPDPATPIQLPIESEQEDAVPGFVTIYRLPPQRSRTRSQLMVGVHVPLPEYAKDLLDKLGTVAETDTPDLELTRPITRHDHRASGSSAAASPGKLRHKLSAPFSRADSRPEGNLLNKVKKRLSFGRL